MWKKEDFTDEQIKVLVDTLKTNKQTSIMSFLINDANTENRKLMFIHGNGTISYKTMASEIGVVASTVKRIYNLICEVKKSKETDTPKVESKTISTYKNKRLKHNNDDYIHKYEIIYEEIKKGLAMVLGAFNNGIDLKESLEEMMSVEDGISRDILHYVEFEEFTEDELSETIKTLKESRLQRRNIINSLSAIKNLTSEAIVGDIFIRDIDVVLRSVLAHSPHYKNKGMKYNYDFIDISKN